MNTPSPASDPAIHTVHAGASPEARAEIVSAIAAARRLLDEGDAEAAMQRLRPIFDEDRAQAQVRSWYGLTLGLSRRRYHEALALCQSAVKQEFFNPELYVNVAQLNLAFGFKAESLRYLRRARMIDPGNQTIRRLLEDLGPRRDPVLRFLPRGHILNRWLGSVRHLLLRGADAPEPDPESFESPPREHAPI
jgi:tetratricopeptide (TPR) repeat protein